MLLASAYSYFAAGNIVCCDDLYIRKGAARPYKGGEEARERGLNSINLFRVTLRGHDEAIAWHFEQLRDAILGATGDAHSFARVLDALVMETIDQNFSLAQNVFHAAAGFNSDVMREMSARQMPV